MIFLIIQKPTSCETTPVDVGKNYLHMYEFSHDTINHGDTKYTRIV